MDGACHPTKLKFNFLSESLNLFDRLFGLLILSVSLWITFYPPPLTLPFLKTETKRVLRRTAWWREGEGGGGHKSCMYERVRMTLDYMKKLLQLTIKEREINIRIRNKLSISRQPQNYGTPTCFGKTVVFILRSSVGERGMRVNSW